MYTLLDFLQHYKPKPIQDALSSRSLAASITEDVSFIPTNITGSYKLNAMLLPNCMHSPPVLKIYFWRSIVFPSIHFAARLALFTLVSHLLMANDVGITSNNRVLCLLLEKELDHSNVYKWLKLNDSMEVSYYSFVLQVTKLESNKLSATICVTNIVPMCLFDNSNLLRLVLKQNFFIKSC